MNRKTIYTILFFILLLFLATLYASINATISDTGDTDEKDDPKEIEEPLELIHVKHQYKNGIHTFAGSLIIDNDCSDRLTTEVLDEGPTLVFTTIDDNPGGPCTKEAFKVYPYKIFHTSDVFTEYQATVNGVPMRLNLYEISPDEDIDEVDLFIKG